MRHPSENSVIIIAGFIKSIGQAYYHAFRGLFGLESRSTMRQVMITPISRILHACIWFGPKSFRTHPTAIKIGRALFVPLMILFKKK